ncbi:hypothetical protein [Streptomyces sp. NPDC008121]|uniref:hypothetical protein n=1 Tax=Streptomyces sp. NPDC008121 TaxID=3364809 RepID=UPI0036E3B8DA
MSAPARAGILSWLPARRGRFVRAGLYGVLLAAGLSALPAQIDWADRAGRMEWDGNWDAGARFRSLTVSPTMLHGGRTGWEAVLHEALWALVFAGALVWGARWLTVRAARPPARAVLFCAALTVLAPFANMVTLYALGLPDLLAQPALRHERLVELLWDAQRGSAHAMLLGASGSAAAYLAWKPETNGLSDMGSGHPVTVLLRLLRGPLPTVWRRIGLSAAMACGAVVLLFLLSSETARRLLSVSTGLLCPPGAGRSCADGLAGSALPRLPDNSLPRVSPVLFSYIRLYAVQCFLLTFASSVFFLRSFESVRNGPAATLLTGWIAYVVGAFAYAATAEVGLRAGEGLPVTLGDVHELLLPPGSLPHTLLAAPLVGGALALCSTVAGRIRRRRVAPV